LLSIFVADDGDSGCRCFFGDENGDDNGVDKGDDGSMDHDIGDRDGDRGDGLLLGWGVLAAETAAAVVIAVAVVAHTFKSANSNMMAANSFALGRSLLRGDVGGDIVDDIVLNVAGCFPPYLCRLTAAPYLPLRTFRSTEGLLLEFTTCTKTGNDLDFFISIIFTTEEE